NTPLNGQSLTQIFELVRLKEESNWSSLLQKVLFKHDRVLSHARHVSGRDLMVELSPLVIKGDVFEGFVINFSDISLLKASERKRNDVLDFLSHDLRSPLSSMLAMIEISKNKKSVDEMHEMLTIMEKNTHKTLHLAEQFLQLSRANTSEKIKFYDIDFNSIVLNAIDQIWALSNKMNVTIQPEFEQEECWIHAEGDLLERAILNLLSNAIKHSEAGAIVKIKITLLKNELCCCVNDTGCGISIEEQPHLFEMFTRINTIGEERKKGIGLGLAFVDAVAKRHSGYVEVHSSIGEGSRFCLKFPRIIPIEGEQ
ncbi:MAG: HAMP domain-containing histidine kinase, partial [Gammaproteobacteria bacterium]|nr:HAMP domain-containing histidine kinase [Gammaproteobacteria bacterium]